MTERSPHVALVICDRFPALYEDDHPLQAALTELGQSLYALVEGLEKWAETHIDDVQAARAAYDSAV